MIQRCFIYALICFVSVFGYVVDVSADINHGVIAYYPLNGNADDESGNGNNGDVNGPALTTDRFGNRDSAYSFDGDDYIAVPDSEMLKPYNISISAWVNPRSLPRWASVIMKSSSSSWDDGYGIASFGDNGIQFFVNNYSISYVGDTLECNKWTHIVSTYDGLSMKFYINGSLANVFQNTDSISHSDDDLLIGQGAGGYGWIGKIDDVRIYNRELSESEVKELYNPYDAVVIDTDEPTVNVSFKTDQPVNLKCKAEPGQKMWVFLKLPELFGDLEFARPNDAYCYSRERYVFVVAGESVSDLYYHESFGSTRIDFGMNNFTGLGTLIIITKTGDSPDNLQTIQTITLTEEK